MRILENALCFKAYLPPPGWGILASVDGLLCLSLSVNLLLE